jgi:hypothetical protein
MIPKEENTPVAISPVAALDMKVLRCIKDRLRVGFRADRLDDECIQNRDQLNVQSPEVTRLVAALDNSIYAFANPWGYTNPWRVT